MEEKAGEGPTIITKQSLRLKLLTDPKQSCEECSGNSHSVMYGGLWERLYRQQPSFPAEG